VSPYQERFVTYICNLPNIVRAVRYRSGDWGNRSDIIMNIAQ